MDSIVLGILSNHIFLLLKLILEITDKSHFSHKLSMSFLSPNTPCPEAFHTVFIAHDSSACVCYFQYTGEQMEAHRK